jgi:hypothetical protein
VILLLSRLRSSRDFDLLAACIYSSAAAMACFKASSPWASLRRRSCSLAWASIAYWAEERHIRDDSLEVSNCKPRIPRPFVGVFRMGEDGNGQFGGVTIEVKKKTILKNFVVAR